LPHLHALLFVNAFVLLATATLLEFYNGDHGRFLRIKMLINKLLARAGGVLLAGLHDAYSYS
jgi:hypothetical protein